MASQCDLCAYYWIDEEDGTGECQVKRIRGMHRDSVYRRVSLDGIVKEQIKEVMEVAEQMSEEVLQELEKSFCNTI